MGTFVVTFTWENNDEFKMETTLDSDDTIKVMEIEENGDIASLWEHYQTICEKVVKNQLNTIGEEMKK